MRIEKFIWDMTYACPLRCAHCYSESGRRGAGNQDEEVLRIAQMIAAERPKRVSLSGGEPLLVKSWAEAARKLCEAGSEVTLFTSGQTVDEAEAERLAQAVTSVCVSVDGATAETHDALRGRKGAFGSAMRALAILDEHKRRRAGRGYTLGVDFTVVRSNLGEMEHFVEQVTARFAGIDSLRFAMAMPVGLASEEGFARREILTDEQSEALLAAGPRLQRAARSEARVSITDVRGFLLHARQGVASPRIAHLEPDGQMRAFPIYEAKVGNVLEEPLDVLWPRVLAWRNEPFVVEQLGSIVTNADWARAARTLDRRYGSAADKARIVTRLRRSGGDKRQEMELGSHG